MRTKWEAAFPYLLLAAAIGFRFFPNTLDFTPVGAMLLVAGACLPARRLWIPLAAVMASDFALTTFRYHAAHSPDQYFTWLAWAVTLGLGWLLRNRQKAAPIVVATLASSLSFFVISDFGVWLAGGLYPKTYNGLVACFVAAVPFYRQMAAGDLIFSAVFFSALAWLRRPVAEPVMAPAGQ